MLTLVLAGLLGFVADPPASGTKERPRPFVVKIVDDETLRGIPLVELRTVNHVKYFTDSGGLAAIDEPGYEGQEVYFSVSSPGYSYPTDKFGNSGTTFKVEAGREATLAIRRVNVAERLYRVTGEGIYRDTVLAGRTSPIRDPFLNGKVLGSDSVLQAVYHDKLYWFWGDTNRPGYPLGNFHTSGATSFLPKDGGLDPEIGVDLTYFVDDTGFAKPMAKMPGPGPTWLGGLIVLRDKEKAGRERMFAFYEKIRNDQGPGSLEAYQRGLVEFDDQANEFRKVAEFPGRMPLYPLGHPFLHAVDGVEYVYYANPFPLTRVRADPEWLKDLSKYETFSPCVAGSLSGKEKVERDATGRVVYGWKRNTPLCGQAEQRKLLASKALTIDEILLPIRDETTSRPITVHYGSLGWNPWRGRWIAIFVESGGTTYLGEVWYAEADTPLGPWQYARRVTTHSRKGQNYSFYNPKQHPVFDKDKGRTIFFEGTYSVTFSGNTDPTPRYDYNQIMYKLDLARPEMVLPVPVYETSDRGPAGPLRTADGQPADALRRPVPFYAMDRPTSRAMPIREYVAADGSRELKPGNGPGSPVFYILPYGTDSLPPSTTPLLEFLHEDGRQHAYSVDPEWKATGFRRTGRVLGHVWTTASRVVLPRE